jgi:hypothetical protein
MYDDAWRHKDVKKKITSNSNKGDFPGRYMGAIPRPGRVPK